VSGTKVEIAGRLGYDNGMKSRTRAAVMTILLLVTTKLPAITWCHDYSLYAVTGRDCNRTSPGQLRSELTRLGYRCFPFTHAARMPRAQSRLRKGDVIIIGDAHSGVVNAGGGIDHFVQQYGASGTAYPAGKIFNMSNFHRDWTLLQMVRFERQTPDGRTINPYRELKVEVWRKTP